jgi:ABC-type nickel/cobalt efflux system permease component RcnA
MRRSPAAAAAVLVLFLCAVLLLYAVPLLHAQNPFLSDDAGEKPGETDQENKERVTLRYPAFVQSFIQRVSALQRGLNSRMTELGRGLAEGEKSGALLLLVLISLGYGVVHAVGPGHGKVVSFSYCLTEKRKPVRGVLFGIIVAFTQVLVAILLVTVLYFLLKRTLFDSIESFRSLIRLVSAGLIAGLGLWLFLGSLGLVPSLHKLHTHGDGCSTNRALLPAALSIGIIPCPGATLIMLFSINMGIARTGVLLSFAFALGMSIIISAVGLATVSAKNFIAGRFRSESIVELLHLWAGRIGGFLLLVVGGLIILSAT